MIYLAVLKRVITPKRALILAIVLATFGAGWTTNGWRYQARIAASEADLIEAYSKQRDRYLQEYREQQTTDQAAVQRLSDDLQTLRNQRRALQNRLRDAAVVKSSDEICNGDGSGNPFGDDFSRLWNDATSTD